MRKSDPAGGCGLMILIALALLIIGALAWWIFR